MLVSSVIFVTFILLYIDTVSLKLSRNLRNAWRKNNEIKRQKYVELQVEEPGFPGLRAHDTNLVVDKTASGTIKQKVDHESSMNDTFDQNYFIDTSNYQANGPLFLIIAGEWTSEEWHLSDSDALHMASEFGAAVAILEHRYYGTSFILSKDSNLDPWNPRNGRTLPQEAIDHLKYLTIDQALADIVNFVSHLKAAGTIGSLSKVVVFGCSYAGTLAAYFRAHHPEIASGAISCSGPFFPKYNIDDWPKLAANALKKRQPTCHGNLDKALKDVAQRVANKLKTYELDTQQELKTLFLNESDLQHLSNPSGDLLQTYYKALAAEIVSFLENIYQPGSYEKVIAGACPAMNSSEVKSLNAFLIEYAKKSTDIKPIDKIDDVSFDNILWAYQQCTEIGFFTGGSSKLEDWFPKTKDPTKNGLDVDLLEIDEQAKDICGIFAFKTTQVQKNIDSFCEKHREKLKVVGNFILVQGELDPWNCVATIPENLIEKMRWKEQEIEMYVVKNGFHCPNLHEEASGDGLKLVKAAIKKWTST